MNDIKATAVAIFSAAFLLCTASPILAQTDLSTLVEDAESTFAQQSPSERRHPNKAPVPAAAAARQSLANVKEIFREEFAGATTPEKKLAFARFLLTQADKTPEPIDRWVLFTESMRMASDAGDLSLSFDAIAKASQQFRVDADSLQLGAITNMGTKAAADGIPDLARASLAIAQKAADKGNTQTAQKAISLASGFATKARNKTLVAEVAKVQRVIREREKNDKDLAAIKAKLQASPGDADVGLDAGKYFCFKVDNWERGLPLLAKGSDLELARLAQADMNAGTDPPAITAAADAWWAWAEREKPPRKAAAFSRAARLYESVVADTNGLERARLEKRIRQALADNSGGKRIYLADIKEQKTRGLNMPLTKDGTFNGKPLTCSGKPWSRSLVAMPFDKASLVYELPRGSKRLIGAAGVFTPAGATGQPGSPLVFEIIVDGHVAWTSPPLSKRDESVAFEVELYGASEIELVTKCTNPNSAWAAWLDPAIAY